MQRAFKTIATSVLTIVCGLTMSFAQAAPPIRMLVGFSPGGTTDIIARLVANEMGKRLDTQIVVENRAGASGNIAAAQVADAAANGLTMLFAPSSHATNATLYSSKFDSEKDFSAVGLVATTPYILVTHPSLPVNTVPELIKYLKERPGEIAYASASPGTAQHLAGEMFKRVAGVNMLHVPYKGSAAAFPDLAAGRTPIMFDNIAVVLPHIKSGAVKAIAMTSNTRSSLLPDVPTIAQSGLPNFEMSGWFALLVPDDTEPGVISKLNQALNETVNDPAFKRQLENMGAQTATTSPEEADAFIKTEIAKWREVIKNAGIATN
ncbi:tripartite tricarboxylate transporter substrate binding protein [Candidimonas sp. SYP-B2681]|uniref:tripartite tricarboxylate transporter substrate binding protein n=1 Tax=Candidimonas sp. SYP-B2681 TaxID=2497686 RepID=UPI000F87724D|nr:tripartite tricarboxylate transporter substrate binding protein [Candidimonas sp. SYP-B2681]RTZ45511.1 tripartite tricarboxylate transporter substrate binding protein [Candidimonas sp. SYP-B2681]